MTSEEAIFSVDQSQVGETEAANAFGGLRR
jgi:hypothetical protein